MKSIMTRTTVMSGAKAVMLGLALISLVNCNSSDDSTPQPTSGGSAAQQSPLAFVNNKGDKTLTSVALKGDSGNAVVGTIASAEFENVALEDMQYSEGEWLFVNLGDANKVATIDPLTGATPEHRDNLPTGTRPVHIYRDPTNGEVIWSMNDGDNTGGTDDDLINCAAQTGSSVTILHNSHLGSGGTPPTVEKTVCLLADGHHVTAFSSGDGVPKRAFVSSEIGGEIAVINNEPGTGQYDMIHRIDLCKAAKEGTLPAPATCNPENPTGTTAFTPNNAGPHGIRWSKLTKKVYSIQEGYGEIAEVDPTTLAITRTFDLAGTPYTGIGITPDGRFLLLGGETTAPDPQATKLGVIDLSLTTAVITNLTIPELDGTSPGSFKFSPNGKGFYILAGNAVTSTKKDRLFAFDASTLSGATPKLTLIKEIVLNVGGDRAGFDGGHGIDILAQGAGEAKYIAVSNRVGNSLSIINATDNLIKQTVPVGASPGAVLVYYPDAASTGNQATASLTGRSKAKPSVLPERLDDHGMPQ